MHRHIERFGKTPRDEASWLRSYIREHPLPACFVLAYAFFWTFLALIGVG